MHPRIEVCVESLEGAIAAQKGGADRVELCANLLEGGTTPSPGTIELARRNLTIELAVMIRPRGGDFCYSDAEFEVMKRDIEFAKSSRADTVVFGILLEDGAVDRQRNAALVAAARPLKVTFHRAFDMARDPYSALEDLVELGVDRMLTTGQQNTLLEGIELVSELVARAADRIVVMPGGDIGRYIRKVLSLTGARELHVIGQGTIESRMRFRNERCFMGGELRPQEYSHKITDAGLIRSIVNEAKMT
ncbi:MAG TPA: copper homeostasis protein CutC [Acidobacteriota bacterium]|jgi:copper homeostasis protein